MSDPRPLVVLLHGLARRSGSLSRLRRRLEEAGFDTWARTYPSRKLTITDAAAQVADWIHADAGDRELYAVTHSMGGILLRHLADPRLRWRRIVMLAPPNQGSQVAQSFRQRPLFRWFYGPAGHELGERPPSWPPPPAPFAVIAGTRHESWTNPTSWVTRMGEPNDGTVAVSETQIDGMAAFTTVDATHTWIMNDPRVHRHVLEFLQTGRFE